MPRGVKKNELERIKDLQSEIDIIESTKARKIKEYDEKISSLKLQIEELSNAYKARQLNEIDALLNQYGVTPEELRVLLVEQKSGKGN